MSRALGCLLLILLFVVTAPTRARAQPVPLGDEFIVNSETPGYQAKPAIASDAAGRFVVVWSGAGSIRGQRFDADGAPSGTELEVSPGLHEVRVEVRWDESVRTERIVGSFRAGATRRLEVNLGRIRRDLELEWN